MRHTLLPVLGLSLALMVSPSQAQGPPPLGAAFTYQGKLTDGGAPANGTYDFEFKLYDDLSGGIQVGNTVTQDDVTVTDGLFTAQLDFGSGAFQGESRYLKIGVRPGSSTGTYATLTPRQPLTAAPYASYALAAPWSGLSGIPAGFADGVDDDTTYTAGTGLTLSGSEFSLLGSYRLPQACTNGQLSKWNGSAWTCTADNDTTYTAGTGLTPSGGQFSLDTAYTDGRYWQLGGNTLSADGSLGSANNYALNFVVNNQRALRLEPNAASPNVIGGYSGNTVTSGVSGATIGGGGSSDNTCGMLNNLPCTNRVTDDYGTVGGGYYNQAGDDTGTTSNNPFATVGGGQSNNASGLSATVGGGGGNTASGVMAAVGGGEGNTASGWAATVGGGSINTASGYYATVPGGQSNTAQGYNSFAAGRRAKANNQGCFVWGDATDADVTCSNDNRAIFRTSGGYYIYTNSGLTSGMYLSSGGSSWNAVSNRALKENFAPVDTLALLERLAAIPITTWNYKAQDPAIRHIGPMADDFNALVDGLGGEGADYINSLDADGVSLAAIQGLYQVVQEKDAQIADLQSQISTLEARLTALEQGRGAAANPVPLNLALPGAGLALTVGLVWLKQRKEQER